MKNKVIPIQREEIEGKVREYFLESSGLSREGKKFEKIRSRADSIWEEIKDRVEIFGLVTYHDKPELREDCLLIQGEEFCCPPFQMMETDEIEGAYTYIITGGDFYLEDREIMDQLLADIWGTAYVDAGREALYQRLVADCDIRQPSWRDKFCLSPSFGPGYYGMETGDVRKLLAILDGGAIGVECRESGVMVPLKSCTGIHLLVNQSTQLPGAECETCLGNIGNCRLCSVRRG